jgi:ABC-type uncharacterized transport system permease subunit
VAIIAILVLHSYQQWGMIGSIFSFQIGFKGPWVAWFAEASTWASVVLTFLSGWLYLWRNRELYLRDM